MVELSANGQEPFEQVSSVNLKFTKQSADFFNMASFVSSFTNSFIIPKTPHNTQILQQLGIVGDTSNIPYSQVVATLRNYGFTLIQKGWLDIKNTDDNYKAAIIDGIIDFFKAIENQNMGSALDLTNFNHIKDMDSVVDSFDNDYYKYIIADYNGKLEANYLTDLGINIDYLAPCFNVGKLFDLVFSTFGFSVNRFNTEILDDLYITYPKPPEEDVMPVLSAEMHRSGFVSNAYAIGNNYYTFNNSYRQWTTSTINEGVLLSNWRYEVGETSGYDIELKTEIYARYKFLHEYSYHPMFVQILVNGIEVLSFSSDPYNEVVGNITLYLTEGDIVEVLQKVQGNSRGAYYLYDIRHNSTNLEISKTNQGNVSLSDAFKDYPIKDFIKECFIRCAVVPIINPIEKDIHFASVSERLDLSNRIDWSGKFVKRLNESYINDSFSQKNGFRHKYNNDDDVYNDGFLIVNNKNLTSESTLYQSKIYAPEQTFTTFNNVESTLNFVTPKFPIWQKEAKEDADNNLSISYKGLTNRFYILKLKNTASSSWRLVSEAIPTSQVVDVLPYADISGTTYDQIVPDKYSLYSDVINNFRLHNIELSLSLNDFIDVDLMRPYYFDKEAANYIINRIIYEDGKNSVAECIKINKT